MASPVNPADELRKKAVRTSPVLWILGFVFACFLGALGTRVLTDIARAFREPYGEEFRAAVRALNDERSAAARAPDERRLRIDRAERDLEDEERTLRSAEASFSSWLRARATLGGSEGEDREVRARRDKLDQLRSERDKMAADLSRLRDAPDPRLAKLKDLDERIAAAERAADDEWSAAHRAWATKVLAARLAIVVPVWLLAGFLWTRRQRSRYPTLLWGYFAFSVWTLVFGVWPFLPHYGGYLPLAIGSAGAVWGSISLVRFFNKRAPLRRRRIVDASLARHHCPACDHDFLLAREIGLDLAPGRKGAVRHYDARSLRPRHCPSCGLELWGPCPSCKEEQLLLQPGCSLCGARYEAAEEVETAPAKLAGA